MSNNFEIILRKDWNAHAQSGEIENMLTPVTHIRFTHTASETCVSQEECSKVLHKIQQKHMEILSFNDICYNFMIGADGRVYEGRGWNQKPDLPGLLSDLTGTLLDVAYIGNFEDDKPPPLMLKVAFDLVICAVRTRKLFHSFEGMHLV